MPLVAVDVMQLVDDHRSFVAEARRLLRPGGRMVLTSWEGLPGAPARFPRHLAGMLKSSGFDVELAAEQPVWLARQLAIYRQAQEACSAPPVDPAIADLASEGHNWQRLKDQTRRLIVAARRRAD